MRRAGAYLSEVPFKGSTQELAPGLNHKHWTRLERLARDRYSSSLHTYSNYINKKFYNFGPVADVIKLFTAVS